MPRTPAPDLITLTGEEDLWSRCFVVAPLTLIGSREPAGKMDFAPKHMAMPLGWERYFGFVCTPRHSTYRNIERRRQFTVTYLQADQVLLASLAAAPRCGDDSKPSLGALPRFPASRVDGCFVEAGYFFLECELDRIIDGFGVNSLIVGRVVRAHVRSEVLRGAERDDQDLIFRAPLPAYLHPGRYGQISESFSFPFPDGYRR